MKTKVEWGIKPLTIYKASAGSGKTFTLAADYISLLVLNPENFRHILAVTFTNKATSEMKARILSQLYGIAHELPKSDDFLKKVIDNVEKHLKKKNPNLHTRADIECLVRKRAATALSLLTHNYNYFRVQTIDAFFQTVLRNLAHELDLTTNLRISLKDDEVEAQAVDEMIQSLQPGAKELKWIGDYIQENIEENRSWRVIDNLKEFGLTIFKEFYKNNSKLLNQLLSTPGYFDSFVKKIRLTRDETLADIAKPYQAMLELIQAEGLDDPQWYSGADTSCDLTYIKKLAALDLNSEKIADTLIAPTTSTRQKHIDNPDSWIAAKNKKTDEGQHLVALARTNLSTMLAAAEENRLAKARTLLSAIYTLKHLNQLRLLRAIEKAVDDDNQATNRFLLSNTQHLLQTMIDGSDTPFIFEKIGAMLRHIMIDEFQDTSTVQWANFKVLLDNCISQTGSHCLIVGDVKQSIYRWRSGDWTLLNNMSDNAITHIESLQDNYRSSRDVVEFNNAFFTLAAEQETKTLSEDGIAAGEQLIQAYSDVKQNVKKTEKRGSVSVLLIKQTELSSQTYKEEQLNAIVDKVCQWIDEGKKASDIAILIRGNNEILTIADHFAHCEKLQQRNVRLISDEAFCLNASLSVCLIMTALHVIAHTDDVLSKALLVKNYHAYVLRQPLDESQLLACEPKQRKAERNRLQNAILDSFLPKDYVTNIDKIATMPILDLIDLLYELFSLKEVSGQTAYICAFHDQLAEYLEDHVADIDDITKYWEETLGQKKVQSDNVEGIRIMTVHKSKGLEYKHVIIPFCDWKLEKTNQPLWCTKDRPAPFDGLPIVPIDYSAKMLQTVYAEDYKEEHFQNIVDNLNILYVAFTRAEQDLFVIGKRSAPKNTRSCLLENVLQNIIQKNLLPGAILCEDNEDTPKLIFEFGEEQSTSSSRQVKVEAHNANVFEVRPKTQTIQIETFKQSAVFRQSNRSRDFVKSEDVNPRNTYIQRGNILHEIFSTIHTLDDVESALAQLTLNGLLTNNQQTLDDIRAHINKCLSKKEIRDWFSDRWTLFNECSILTIDPENDQIIEHRPDRVMKDGNQTIVVDFKFGHPRPEYHKQVRRYVELLQQMGEKNVQGYLWYVLNESVEKVK